MTFSPAGLARSLATGLVDWANPISRDSGLTFDPGTSISPPHGGRSSWVHYGVMVPNLPAPHNSFGIMSIIGTPGVEVFANDQAITTNPSDTAYAVSATDAMTGGQFNSYSIARECQLAPDGSRIKLGSEILIEGEYPDFRVRRWHPEATVDLNLKASDKITHFFAVRAGLYRHWSLLCEYTGTINGETQSGLCTFEYAHGAGVHSIPHGLKLNLPSKFFMYHVLNLDADNQIVFGQAQGPGGIDVIRSASLRQLQHPAAQYQNIEFTVTEWSTKPAITAAGAAMRTPERIHWVVRDDNGDVITQIIGEATNAWAPGLGAGVVGSYTYTGAFRGTDISGSAYLEWVDLRRGSSY